MDIFSNRLQEHFLVLNKVKASTSSLQLERVLNSFLELLADPQLVNCLVNYDKEAILHCIQP